MKLCDKSEISMYPQLVSRTLEAILTILIAYTFEYLLSLLMRSEPQLVSIVKNELRKVHGGFWKILPEITISS